MDLIKTTITDGLKAFTNIVVTVGIYFIRIFVYIIIYILFQKYRITIML